MKTVLKEQLNSLIDAINYEPTLEEIADLIETIKGMIHIKWKAKSGGIKKINHSFFNTDTRRPLIRQAVYQTHDYSTYLLCPDHYFYTHRELFDDSNFNNKATDMLEPPNFDLTEIFNNDPKWIPFDTNLWKIGVVDKIETKKYIHINAQNLEAIGYDDNYYTMSNDESVKILTLSYKVARYIINLNRSHYLKGCYLNEQDILLIGNKHIGFILKNSQKA
jgi:hypothetical protein